MLATLGLGSMTELADAIVPENIRKRREMSLPAALSESDALAELKTIAGKNQVVRTLIGQGYYQTLTPLVIQRNVLENPAWYTAYTPYQPEISQGRLEAIGAVNLRSWKRSHVPCSGGERRRRRKKRRRRRRKSGRNDLKQDG
jgi:glycine cleavage system pyridoxal-binding protein P